MEPNPKQTSALEALDLSDIEEGMGKMSYGPEFTAELITEEGLIISSIR